MKEINKGDMIVVHFRSGMVMLGKMGEASAPDLRQIDSPRVLQARQTGGTVELSLPHLVGMPESIVVEEKDIFMLYALRDGNMIAQYIKETTGLTLASVIPTKQ